MLSWMSRTMSSSLRSLSLRRKRAQSRTPAHDQQRCVDDDGGHGHEHVSDDDDDDDDGDDEVGVVVPAAHRTAMVGESAAVADHAAVR